MISSLLHLVIGHNTGLSEKNSFPHLLDAIGPSAENESDLIEQSKYYDDHEFKSVLQKFNSKISILSLNCQSINAKFDKIKIFLDGINDMNSLSIICIQETWSQDDIDMTVLIFLIILYCVQIGAYLRMAVLLYMFMMTLPLKSLTQHYRLHILLCSLKV